MVNNIKHDESETRPSNLDDVSTKTNRTENRREPQFAAERAVRRAVSLGGTGWKARFFSDGNKRRLVIGALLGGVALIAIVAYLLLSNSSEPATSPVVTQKTPQNSTSSSGPPLPAPPREAPSGLGALLGIETATIEPRESWPLAAARIALKLALGALLAALLAFRPRRDFPALLRNPYVAQTQILLAVVAAALMMVVSDNAARAFGIFAAASLVRFRTNIRDPKEITVLLISLAIGLATGVGKIEVAIILSLFVLLVLSVLEHYEPEQVFRAMELTVTTRKVDETDEILQEVFEKRNMTSELRKVDREDPDNPMGKIVYFVTVGGDLSTDKLSEEIFSSDSDNIDSVQWDQKKSSSYIYR
jgi:uncharacterized membrane protein YhiD involved in acid resistance